MSNKPGRPAQFKHRDCIQVPVEASLKDALKTIADREGKQLAELFREITKDPVEAYVKAHLAGNKQFTLDLSSKPDFVALPAIGETPPTPEKMKEKYSQKDLQLIAKRAKEWVQSAESAFGSTSSSSPHPESKSKKSLFIKKFCSPCGKDVVMPYGEDAHNFTHHKDEWIRQNPPEELPPIVVVGTTEVVEDVVVK